MKHPSAGQAGTISLPPLIAIVGPTATGKTDLALRLAGDLQKRDSQQRQPHIICVDSMQVYKGLDVGTATPTKTEQALFPHHGLDLAHPTERFNANDFAETLMPVIEDLGQKGIPAILCGGTGLYFRSLLEGLDPAPHTDPGFRRELESRAEAEGPEALHSELMRIDPHRGSELHPNDLRRIIRALEIAHHSGQKPSELQSGQVRAWVDHTLFIGLDPGQEVIRARIAKRLERMLGEGLLAETAWLLELGWERVTTAKQAVGYKEFVPYLHGNQSLADCLTVAQQHTARLAARQRSWFRHQIQAVWHSNGNEDYPCIWDTVEKYFLSAPSLL